MTATDSVPRAQHVLQDAGFCSIAYRRNDGLLALCVEPDDHSGKHDDHLAVVTAPTTRLTVACPSCCDLVEVVVREMSVRTSAGLLEADVEASTLKHRCPGVGGRS